MPGGTIRAVIKASNESSGAFSAAGDDAERMQRRITQASLALSAGFLAAGAVAVNMAADFEHSMSQVGAVAGASEAEMKRLSQAALDIGRDTAFGASDAAAAMQELAAGGRSVTEILGGEARAAVDLAAAANTGLAESGRTIATAMDIWKGTTIATTDVVNRLAGAANASRFGAEDMSMAIAQAGGVAAAMGVSFDDFTTAIASTASSFASGSDAGTSYKTFLLSLDGSTEKARAKIEELGLEFRDAQGNIRDTAEIAGELAEKLGSLTEAEKVEALKTIFGNDAYRFAAGMMQAADSMERIDAVLTNTDAAAIAAQRMDNLNGSLEELKGSAETLAIELGAKAIPAMTQMTEFATTAVNAFGGLPESTQGLALGFAAVAAVAPAAASGVRSLATAAAALSTGTAGAGLGLGAMALGIGAVAIAADAILLKTSGSGLIEHIFGDPGAVTAGVEAVRDMNAALAVSRDPIDRLAIAQQQLGLATRDATNFVHESRSAWELVKDNVTGASSNWDELEARVRAGAEAMVANGATVRQLRDAYQELDPALRDVFDDVTDIERIMSSPTFVDRNTGQDVWIRNLASGMRDAAGAAQEFAPAVDQAQQKYASWAGMLGDSLSDLEKLEQRISGLAEAFRESDPLYEAYTAKIAVLRSELEKMSETDSFSENLGLTRAEIEGMLGPMEEYVGNIDAMNASMAAALAPLGDLVGANGIGGLVEALGTAGAPLDAVEAAVQNLTIAFADAKTGGIEPAMQSLLDAKAKLDTIPGAWAAVAATIGPEFVKTLNESLGAGSFDAIIATIESEGVAAGAALVAGMVAGINAQRGTAIAAAGGLATSVADIVRQELIIQSPSRVFHDIGMDVAEGFALGIKDGTKLFVPGAAAGMADTAVSSIGPPGWAMSSIGPPGWGMPYGIGFTPGSANPTNTIPGAGGGSVFGQPVGGVNPLPGGVTSYNPAGGGFGSGGDLPEYAWKVFRDGKWVFGMPTEGEWYIGSRDGVPRRFIPATSPFNVPGNPLSGTAPGFGLPDVGGLMGMDDSARLQGIIDAIGGFQASFNPNGPNAAYVLQGFGAWIDSVLNSGMRLPDSIRAQLQTARSAIPAGTAGGFPGAVTPGATTAVTDLGTAASGWGIGGDIPSYAWKVFRDGKWVFGTPMEGEWYIGTKDNIPRQWMGLGPLPEPRDDAPTFHHRLEGPPEYWFEQQRQQALNDIVFGNRQFDPMKGWDQTGRFVMPWAMVNPGWAQGGMPQYGTAEWWRMTNHFPMGQGGPVGGNPWWLDPFNAQFGQNPNGTGNYMPGPNGVWGYQAPQTTVIVNSAFTDLGSRVWQMEPVFTSEQKRAGSMSFDPWRGR